MDDLLKSEASQSFLTPTVRPADVPELEPKPIHFSSPHTQVENSTPAALPAQDPRAPSSAFTRTSGLVPVIIVPDEDHDQSSNHHHAAAPSTSASNSSQFTPLPTAHSSRASSPNIFAGISESPARSRVLSPHQSNDFMEKITVAVSLADGRLLGLSVFPDMTVVELEQVS